MPKVKKPRKSKKLTYKQMMAAILAPKDATTTNKKPKEGLGGGTFEKVQRI